jgi:hypothetical protein
MTDFTPLSIIFSPAHHNHRGQLHQSGPGGAANGAVQGRAAGHGGAGAQGGTGAGAAAPEVRQPAAEGASALHGHCQCLID